MVVIKRCVDVHDLIASAGTGQADVAVVAGELDGLDADAVMRLLRHDVRCVAVGGSAEALDRIGVLELVPLDEIGRLPEAVSSAGTRDLVLDPEPEDPPVPDRPARPAGSSPSTDRPEHRAAPRSRSVSLRSTPVAAAGRCSSTPTRSAEPWPSTWASSTRSPGCSPPRGWSTSGPSTLPRSPAAGGSSDDGFEVLTGLPRPDRWVEARPGVLDAVLERAAEVGDVVVDTGFSLEDDADVGRNLSRNQLTLDAVGGGRPGRRRGLCRADRAGPAGTQPGRGPRQHPGTGDGGGQPDAGLPGVEPPRHRRDGRGLHPAHRGALPAGGPRHHRQGAGHGQVGRSSSATPRCVAGWSRSTTRSSVRARLRSRPSAGRARWPCSRPSR